ncbi:hypothetical protein [Sphingomonas oryzagri]
MERRLDAFAKSGGIIPMRAYYIWGEFKVECDGKVLYSDEGHEYCFTCAEELLASVLSLLPKGEREEHRVSATDLDHEDTCKHCMVCGALLDYALNETGIASELDHYQGCNLASELHPGDAFHIARMLEAAPADRAVRRLAQDALRRIPPRPAAAAIAASKIDP